MSAREGYFIAALLYSAARWPIFESNDKSIAYNARMIACYDKFAALMNRPIERAEIPFGDKGQFLPGYLHLPREPKPGETFPCVIGIDGMDGSKEIMCSMYGDEFLERGMANFIYDGPGQGECTINGLHVTEINHMEAALAIYDWLAGIRTSTPRGLVPRPDRRQGSAPRASLHQRSRSGQLDALLTSPR